jgi:outer membrane protein, multidrug efflux system
MRKLTGAALVLLLAGCAVGPNYEKPELATPLQFYRDTAAVDSASLADLPWWGVYQDTVLTSLIRQALDSGYSVRFAAARVEEARARYGVAKSQFYPQVNYGAGASQQRLPTNLSGGTGEPGAFYTANVSASWEIDLWGRIRRLNQQAKAQYLATEEAQRGVALSLTTEVAESYFQLRELDALLIIARNTADNFQATYEMFQRQVQGGVASAIQTYRAEAALANALATIPDLERQIVARENQITLLLGRGPGPVPRGLVLESQPQPAQIPPGLPSTLLLRRPDVRAAEQQLIAANANVGANIAAMFPTISLTGLFGAASPELNTMFGAGTVWSVGAGLLGPLFQGGKLRKNVAIAKAQFQQALISYEQAVNNSFGEVSTQLAAWQKLAESEREVQREVFAYQESVRLANVRYLSGLSSYVEVLDAMNLLFPAENNLAQVRLQRLVALAEFYKALGGGWQVEEAQAAAAADSAKAEQKK